MPGQIDVAACRERYRGSVFCTEIIDVHDAGKLRPTVDARPTRCRWSRFIHSRPLVQSLQHEARLIVSCNSLLG